MMSLFMRLGQQPQGPSGADGGGRDALRGATACAPPISIKACIRCHVLSHDIVGEERVGARECEALRRSVAKTVEPSPLGQRQVERVGIAVVGNPRQALLAVRLHDVGDRRRDTPGSPAARYSGVFVGLMKRVASFRANGSIATSQPAR